LPAPHNSGNRITAASVSTQWTGPLPPPEALDRFNQVIPNGAERIFKMAEAEQAHRIAHETDTLRATVAEAKRGQILGASISLLAVASALVSVWLGAHWAVTVALVGVPLMGLAKAIVDSRSRQS
jgi:uncharacterized membrane protein